MSNEITKYLFGNYEIEEDDDSFMSKDNDNKDDGDDPRKKITKLYREMKTMYGTYDPEHKPRVLLSIIIFLILIFPIVYFIRALIVEDLTSDDTAVAISMLVAVSAMGVAALTIVWAPKKLFVFNIKISGKNFTMYRNKSGNLIAIQYGYKDVYEKRGKKDWTVVDGYSYMGTRLLFQYLKGPLKKRKGFKGITKIKTYDKSTICILRDEKLWKLRHYDNKFKKKNSINVVSEELEIFEINSPVNIEIPKSFVDFCKKEGLKYPEENENLRYV